MSCAPAPRFACLSGAASLATWPSSLAFASQRACSQTPSSTPTKPTNSTGVTMSWKITMPLSTVSTDFVCARSCTPTVPRSFVTKSCARFRKQALTQDASSAATRMILFVPLVETNARIGPEPSVARLQHSITNADGMHIQKSRATGSKRALMLPVKTFCATAVFNARNTFARKQRKTPNAEKLTSPEMDSVQEATTKHVGRRSHMLKGMPRANTIGIEHSGLEAPMISVNETDAKTKAMLFDAMEKAKAIAMGRIAVKNSCRLGTGIGIPVFLRRCSKMIREANMQKMK
mmetsp:Transcript_29455/g.51662  ORF Transcript_29455/g.51662 Transcript_29455/m.51662 type:complete len:290 (+) Transcript_29455:87-956(+)